MAAHNCSGYGIELTLYMLPADWDKVEKEYWVRDTNGVTVYGNEQTECTNVNMFRTCTYYLSPENPRSGLLMEPGSYGLMTYAASWVDLSATTD